MSVESDVQAGATPTHHQPAAVTPTGNPALIGLPTFLVGAITLALWLLGYLPATLPGGLIAAVFWPAGVGTLIASLWAARLGLSAVAAIFGIFSMFWLSFGFLVMGLVNGWFGLTQASQATTVQATYLISWLAVFVVLTLATLRLPLAFTALFVVVDITFALVLLGTLNGSSGLLAAGGIGVLLFSLIGVYLFFDGMGQELGSKALPLGGPVIKS